MSVEQIMGSSVLMKIFKIVETKNPPNSNKGIWGILFFMVNYYQLPLAPPPEKSPPPPKPLKES